MRSQYSQEAQYSFKPKINITSEVICAADPNRGNEKEAQRIERLYREDKLKSQVAKQMKEKEAYDQYSFQPKINEISAIIAPQTSLIDRSMNNEGVRRKEKLREEA